VGGQDVDGPPGRLGGVLPHQVQGGLVDERVQPTRRDGQVQVGPQGPPDGTGVTAGGGI